MFTYQTYPKSLYIVTSDAETVIYDGTSEKQIAKVPASSQGIIQALSGSIKTDHEISINLLK